MSGKTKKQKLASQLRKRIQLEQIYQSVAQPSSSSTFIKDMKNSETVQSPTSIVDMSYQSSPQETKVISYFYSDFKKSMFFVSAIIALEIALYFVNIKNYLK